MRVFSLRFLVDHSVQYRFQMVHVFIFHFYDILGIPICVTQSPSGVSIPLVVAYSWISNKVEKKTFARWCIVLYNMVWRWWSLWRTKNKDSVTRNHPKQCYPVPVYTGLTFSQDKKGPSFQQNASQLTETYDWHLDGPSSCNLKIQRMYFLDILLRRV